ncbi:MAG: hypothetical protein AUI89_02705 [Gemmatimonadetes bacterium 13_1_40CM_3_65_8]|nr:MAG: hypothetical protein AUI89_02705 [Gemmatimonadetes bacterium 13_1_40CM_3_65_8]
MLRRQRELDTALDLGRADPRLHDVLRLGAYQLRWLTRVPSHAAVSTAVELARETVGEGSTGYVNQALRKISGAGRTEQGAGTTHPDWLVARWTARFGADETRELLAWNDRRPALTLQPARWSLERLRAALEKQGIHTVPSSVLPAPRDLPGFTEGGWIVQDPAHALVCRFASIPRGELVYDACAAPGGKAVSLEAAGARVVAGDARRDRLQRLADTIRRAGVAIRGVAANLEAAPIRPQSLNTVLVDDPDARWRLKPAIFARAAARQSRLLAAGAALVRPGGLLIYATCSLESEENAGVVDDFLSRHPEFARSPTPASLPAELITPAGDFQSLPQRHGIDGAYAARLVRAS